jgi:four helix bundle protein
MKTNFKGMMVWRAARELAASVYRMTAEFPQTTGNFGLINSIRHAAIAVVSNIAAGRASAKPNEFAQFLSRSSSALAELDTLLLLSVDINILSTEAIDPLSIEIHAISEALTKLQIKINNLPAGEELVNDSDVDIGDEFILKKF